MDSIDIVVRKYYDGMVDSLEDELSQFSSEQLADHLSDILNRVPEAMRFALTFTYGYEDQIYNGDII